MGIRITGAGLGPRAVWFEQGTHFQGPRPYWLDDAPRQGSVERLLFEEGYDPGLAQVIPPSDIESELARGTLGELAALVRQHSDLRAIIKGA